MTFFTWILLGVVAGMMINVLDRHRKYRLAGSILLSLTGAVVGGTLAALFLIFKDIKGSGILSFLLALLGAIAFISLSRNLRNMLRI